MEIRWMEEDKWRKGEGDVSTWNFWSSWSISFFFVAQDEWLCRGICKCLQVVFINGNMKNGDDEWIQVYCLLGLNHCPKNIKWVVRFEDVFFCQCVLICVSTNSMNWICLFGDRDVVWESGILWKGYLII